MGSVVQPKDETATTPTQSILHEDPLRDDRSSRSSNPGQDRYFHLAIYRVDTSSLIYMLYAPEMLEFPDMGYRLMVHLVWVSVT